MAAYGLYTHIRSNRRRSIALLIGLFFLVYLMVLPARCWPRAGSAAIAPLRRDRRARLARPDPACAFATAGTVVWILIAYRFHQAMIDALTGGARGDAQGGAAAL